MERVQCRATNRAGERCGLQAIEGGVVCRMHGGLAPAVLTAARRRVIEANVRQVLAGRDITPVTDAVTELERLAGELVAWKDLLAERASEVSDFENVDRLGRSEARALVELYRAALNDAGKLLVDIARLDLSTRRVTIAEQQAVALLAVVEAALSAADLDEEGLITARRAAAAMLEERAG